MCGSRKYFTPPTDGHEPKLAFPEWLGVQTIKPPVGEVWIFSGTTQLLWPVTCTTEANDPINQLET